jgi:hypothetical protein
MNVSESALLIVRPSGKEGNIGGMVTHRMT